MHVEYRTPNSVSVRAVLLSHCTRCSIFRDKNSSLSVCDPNACKSRELCEDEFTRGEEKHYFIPHINTQAEESTHIHAVRREACMERRIVMRQSFVIF